MVTFRHGFVHGQPSRQAHQPQTDDVRPVLRAGLLQHSPDHRQRQASAPLVLNEEKIITTGMEETGQPSEGFTPVAGRLVAVYTDRSRHHLYGIRRKKTLWGIDLVLFFAAGMAGCILTFLVLFSQHPAVSPNYLLFVFHPLHLLCLPCMLNRVRKRRRSRYMLANFLVLTLFILLWLIIPQRFPSLYYLGHFVC